ncbi:hypothetical protein EYR36_007801 [Pleurotus pulmonarius]|nr:hypothetical protein EYR36_007801 [Pleurotus pulmonarius]
MHMPWRCNFSKTALHEGAPGLRSLSISGFTFGLDSPLLCKLTSLDLSINRWDGQALDRLWPTELLHALRNMPQLRSLRLNKSFEPLPVFASPQTVAVTLPVLTHLHFQAEEMPDMKILQYLTLPSIKYIDLKCDEVGDPVEIPYIVPIVHALLPPHDSSTTQTALMLEAGTSDDGTPKSRAIFKLKV